MLKKILLFQCAILLLSLPVPAFEESDIDFLENSLYHRLYENDSLGERINRLENDMLGMSQSGDIDARIEKLLMLNENRFNVAVPKPDYGEKSQKKEGKLKKIFNGISDVFSSGTITGFTPPLGSSYYQNGYSSYGNYSRYNNYNNYPYTNTPGLFDGLPSYCQYYGNRNRHVINNPVNSSYYYSPFYRPYYGGYYPKYGCGNLYNRTNYTPCDVLTKSTVHLLD